ncbi:MAG: hypothetical protein ACI935_001890 [Moritella dasanensis]|jgi:hypothetical protein
MNDETEYELDGQDELDNATVAYPMSPDTPIRIAKEQYSVFQLLRQEKQQRIILSPDFQRNDTWKDPDRSELIESVLLGIPLPLIYLFEDEYGVRQVIDGKQRITALKRFFYNDLKLVGLKMMPHLVGKKFAEIDPYLQAKLEDFQLNTYVIQPPTPEYVKYIIFERVNRSGRQLNKQEMRHGLYQGKVTQLLEDLSVSDAFLTATSKSINPERMRDKYLILRFIAFYLYRTQQLGNYQYNADIDDLLAYTMKFINTKATDETINNIKQACKIGVNNAFQLLGTDAFRFKAKENGKRRRINMGLFEMLVYALHEQDYSLLNDALINSNDLIKQVLILKQELDVKGIFLSNIDSQASIEYRFEIADKIKTGLKNA